MKLYEIEPQKTVTITAKNPADSYSPKWAIMFLPGILVVFGIGYLIYRIFQEKSFLYRLLMRKKMELFWNGRNVP